MNDEIDLKSIYQHKYFWPVILGLLFLATRLPVINAYKTYWWDESQYLVMTKSLFQNTPTTGWWEGRSIMYPWILRVLNFYGYSEAGIKITNLLFGLGFVISSYYLIKKLIGQSKAVIATLLLISHWVFLYWSLRITIDTPSACLLTISALLFIKKGKHNNLLSGVTLGLGFIIRFTSAIAGIVYLLYNLILKKTKLKDYYWILGILIGVSPLLIYDLITFGNPLHTSLSFLTFNLEATGGSQQGDQLYYVSNMLFNYGVIMGLMVFIGLIPIAMKLKNKKILFIALNITTYLIFYSFLTQVKEVRFLIHLLPFMAATAVIGASLIISTFITKKGLNQALTILMILMIIENLTLAYNSVEGVANSYNDIRLAGEFLKQYNGQVMSNSVPQITYYSELETHAFPENKSLFDEQVSNFSFVMVSAYEHHPNYALMLDDPYLQPIKTFPDPQNARVIIYYVNKSLMNE